MRGLDFRWRAGGDEKTGEDEDVVVCFCKGGEGVDLRGGGADGCDDGVEGRRRRRRRDVSARPIPGGVLECGSEVKFEV
jgi:hypothetical protein